MKKNIEDSLEAGKNRLKRAFVSEGLIFETCLNEIDQNEFYDRFNVSKVEDLYVYVAQWRKAKQMQPMWLCILLCKQFGETFDHTQWKKSQTKVIGRIGKL